MPSPPTVKAIPRWTVAAGVAAPALLVAGFLAAAALQPRSYNPVRDTISELASQRATDSWVMTSALVSLGLCYLLCAAGLRPAGRVCRCLLATGGLATLAIAALRQPSHGYSLGHELAVIAAALTCCTWPAFAWHRPQHAPLLARHPSYAAAGVQIGLAAWYALESHGALLGVAERCAAAAPPLWLGAVAVTTRRALPRRPRVPRASDRSARSRLARSACG